VTDPEKHVRVQSDEAEAGGAPLTLEAWLARREPAPPEALLRHLGAGGSATPAPSRLEELLAAATAALGDACGGIGERRGAFRLLAADAYLTWACEAALELEDSAAHLRDMTLAVARDAEAG
jgi:hypothetical protein